MNKNWKHIMMKFNALKKYLVNTMDFSFSVQINIFGLNVKTILFLEMIVVVDIMSANF